jgi:uncharacterized protein YyaL (SSP411 family)
MRPTVISRFAVLLAVLGGLCQRSSGATDETAGVPPRPPALEQRLSAALTGKGPDYRPRTEHLFTDGRPRFTNRLILEDSPYLIQHAHNPVDWYPWGPEAFERARAEGKPVLLSIGYSTCYWCHVMERESFEDLGIATLLNHHFIPIKVDREVRPDLDQVYMTAVELLAGHGGWPMTSILTPEGETIIAGTYFSPEDFRRLLEAIQAIWRDRPEDLRAQARRVAEAVVRVLAVDRQAAELDQGVAKRAAARLVPEYDQLQGGYGAAPKFPREPQLELLLDQALRAQDRAAASAALLTLRTMAHGGIHDQVGGGFHRYAIDNDWLVPHFEKMLYNQAQLARLYARAWLLTGDPELARVARRTLDFVLRDLSSPEGGFYSATDAESEGEEGSFYLWTPAELHAALPPEDAGLAIGLFGATESGNFEGRNILHLPRSPEAFARAEGLALRDLWGRIERITATLERARSARPRPHRDEKILTAWNGLMIAALAEVGDALWDPRYVRDAEQAAELLWSKARAAPGTLHRVYLEGRASVPALQEDYAFLGQGMLALYNATGEPQWLARARELADAMWSRFADPEGGGVFMAEPADAPQMARPKDLADGAMPSGTSAALGLLAGLARRVDAPCYRERASTLSAAVSGQVARAPEAFPSLLVALNRLRLGEAGPRDLAAQGAIRIHARALGRQPPDEPGPSGGRLIVEMAMDPGWHVNPHRPLQDYLIPTTLTGVEGRGWRLGEPSYPEPEVLRLGFQREPLAIYQGQLRIEAPFEPEGAAARPGESPPIVLNLRLQACNDQLCLPPENLSLELPSVLP